MPRVSDEELRKHAEYDPVARELLAAWPEIHAERPTWSDLIARLRTTAEALRDCYRELNEIHARDGLPYTSEGIKAGVSQEWFTAVVENARAILARLEQEGLA